MTTNAEYDYVLAVLKDIRPMLDRMVLPMNPEHPGPPTTIGEISTLSLDGIEHFVRHHALMAGWRPIEMRNDPIVLSRDGHRVADELRGITFVDPETFEELNRP